MTQPAVKLKKAVKRVNIAVKMMRDKTPVIEE
jgi:hypothetical protein